ncbi:hypothetical protein [Helicobacter pylori]|nr:hypothetical protein [Helicobacter pylori]
MFNNDYYFIALFSKPLKPLNQLNETSPIMQIMQEMLKDLF